MRSSRLLGAVLSLLLAPAWTFAAANLEEGKFVLHKFGQPIGEEHYALSREAGGANLTSSFKFTDRTTPVTLEAQLRVSPKGQPTFYSVHGKNARAFNIDVQVEVTANTVHSRDAGVESSETAPPEYFTIAGYAPAAAQMMLYRYWFAHHQPHTLKIFPHGEVLIEPRGKERFTVNGKTATLERFSVAGLNWGRETVWLDSRKHLVAIKTVDAEFDHFEAIREGYESALPQFLASAGKDGMAVLHTLSKDLTGIRAPRLALVGGTLIDGAGGAPLEHATILIEGERISQVGTSELKLPAGTQVVDVTGKTLLPGLWDMHAHFEQVEWGPVYLAAGATTVRDCGNEFEFIVAVRDALQAHQGLGPRLLLAGVVDGSGPGSLGVSRVDTPEQARQWVERYQRAGFQQMKIYSSMQAATVAAVSSAAHARGMSVTGHIPESMTLLEGIDAGMDQVNHAIYVARAMIPAGSLPDKPTRAQRAAAIAGIDVDSAQAKGVIDALVAHHIVIDPTLAIFEFDTASTRRPYAAFEPGVVTLPPELSRQYATLDELDEATQQQKDAIQRNLEKVTMALERAGVPIVAGTDQGVPGHSLYRELELYVQAGFTPMQAIQAATSVPAKVMGESDSGLVQAGKRADIIVLGANPLESIHNIRSVERVMTAGTLYDTAPLWRSVGFKAPH